MVNNKEPLLAQSGNHKIKRVMWCSGNAQNLIYDTYLTREVSEQTFSFGKSAEHTLSSRRLSRY